MMCLSNRLETGRFVNYVLYGIIVNPESTSWPSTSAAFTRALQSDYMPSLGQETNNSTVAGLYMATAH
jgi:hypothetical protein